MDIGCGCGSGVYEGMWCVWRTVGWMVSGVCECGDVSVFVLGCARISMCVMRLLYA